MVVSGPDAVFDAVFNFTFIAMVSVVNFRVAVSVGNGLLPAGSPELIDFPDRFFSWAIGGALESDHNFPPFPDCRLRATI